MSLLVKKLEEHLGKQIIVVMSDHRAFRGTLKEFDDELLVLHDVVEGSPTAVGWEEPTVTTGIREKIITWRGAFSQETTSGEVIRLKDAYIRVSHVLRIWPFDPTNVAKPEHVVRES